MPYEPLHHKYRPQTFKDLVGQETIAQTLSNALKQEKIAPAYLFTGPRGTGKTSSARILAKSLNCLNSDRPTPEPCGQCEACTAIAVGSALDVMEIDAASNTGVDNIREIIERSRFAPVQCRYKIYAIDECLTGDSLIQTNVGLVRMDNSCLEGKQVLSYNEKTKAWEYKKVLRWLDRGIKKTLTIKTKNSQIRCTGNHLIRTEAGWIEAKNVKEGMKILSPVNVDAEVKSINTVRMEEYADLQEDINSKETNTAVSLIISAKSLKQQRQYNLNVNADVKKNSIFPVFFKKRAEELKVSSLTGSDIHIKKDMDFGIEEGKITLTLLQNSNLSNLDLYMEHYLETGALNIPTRTVGILDCAGLMEQSNANGWNIKQLVYNNCVHRQKALLTEGTAKNLQFAIQSAILNYKQFIKQFDRMGRESQSQESGLKTLLQKVWHGGTWMMALFNLLPKITLPSFSILKDFLKQKMKLLPAGLQIWDILQAQNLILENLLRLNIITLNSEQNPVVNGCQTYENIQYLQWNTNFERVESIGLGENERVYDLEVEDNHNFVANGLLVHNCHMLSTAAFNALLKTLEEPPPRVVFILATTDPQRVLSTIISRCQRFDYRRIPLGEMTAHLKYIAEREEIAIATDALTLIAQIANGGLRDAESLLDQLSLLPETITVAKVWDLVGAVPEQDLLKLLQLINGNDSVGVLQQCRSLLDRGREPLVVLQNLAGFYLNLLIAKTAPQHDELTAVTQTCWQQLCAEAANWELSSILQGQQHLKESEAQIKQTTQPRLWLEVTLLGLLPQTNRAIASTTIAKENPLVSTNNLKSSSDRQPSPTDAKNAVAIDPIESPKTPNKQPVNIAPLERQTVPNKTHGIEPKPTAIDRASNTSTSIAARSKEPASVNSQPDPNANKEIWSKVVACLHPPTTQALLKQQCHLVSFDGVSAIVGISSAKLQKLNQGKIPNIEAAFAKVCQRQIKVQLEVANSQGAANNATLTKSVVPTQPQPTPIAKTTSSSPKFEAIDAPETQSLSVQQPARVSSKTKAASPAPASSNFSSDRTVKSNISKSVESTKGVVEFPSNIEPLVAKPTTIEPEAITQVPAELATSEGEQLQQAIDNLTLSFEGELVQLNKELNEKSGNPDKPSIPSSIDPNRPNAEEYEDEW